MRDPSESDLAVFVPLRKALNSFCRSVPAGASDRIMGDPACVSRAKRAPCCPMNIYI
jgi:hypothetical protein